MTAGSGVASTKMDAEGFVLEGTQVRLEPLEHRHAHGLVTAAAADPSLYKWSPIPQGHAEVEKYIDIAIAWRDAGTAVPFATIRRSDGAVIGSTRFWNLERWSWPQGHPLQGRTEPDACEIGYTWLTQSAVRTPANTEAKFLMLTHAFEVWQVRRVCFHTDVRNQRSRAALERLGGQFEGILRSHRMAADYLPRDSARFSMILSEWPGIKEGLLAMMSAKLANYR
jgi:N-acetyltransferase